MNSTSLFVYSSVHPFVCVSLAPFIKFKRDYNLINNLNSINQTESLKILVAEFGLNQLFNQVSCSIGLNTTFSSELEGKTCP